MNFNEAKVNNEDRISQLPFHILHRFIYFLGQIDDSLKSVSYFSMSSKTCYQAWISNPHHYFTLKRLDWDYDIEKENNFVKFVDRTLYRLIDEGLTVESFRLRTRELYEPQNLNRWIQWVCALKVKQVHLYFSVHDFKLPLSFLSHFSSLQELNLQACCLEPIQHGSKEKDMVIKLPSLRRLSLIYVSASSDMVVGILKGCPLLEDLEIVTCMGFESLHVSGLSNLKCLNLDCRQQMSINFLIEARFLEEFSYSWVTYTSLMSCLNVASCWSTLRKLSLNGLNLSGNQSQFFTQFAQLESLTITSCNGLNNVKISSPSIKYIKLVYCNILGVFQICCPNLCVLHCQDYAIPFVLDESKSSRYWKLELYLNQLTARYKNKNKFFDELRRLVWDTEIQVSHLHVEITPKRWITQEHGFHHINIDGVQLLAPWTDPIKLKSLELKLLQCDFLPYEILNEFFRICHPESLAITFIQVCKEDFYKVLQSILRNMVIRTRPTFECDCGNGGDHLQRCWQCTLAHYRGHKLSVRCYW